MSVQQLEKAVERLSPNELASFTRWLDGYVAAHWEERLATDVAAGRLDHLARQADEAFLAGRCTEL